MRASTALETLHPIYTEIWKVTVASYQFGTKHCSTLKINQLIFIKQFENTSPCPDKIYTFSYMFQNFFTTILEGLYSPVHVDQEYKR